MSDAINPAAPHHLPIFIAGPGQTDMFLWVMATVLVVVVMAVGLLFLRLHTLPERIAHRGHKLQFEIVAVLGLLSLFTHVHLFWVIGLLLALIDLPDFGGALGRIARALERMAGSPRDDEAGNGQGETSAVALPEEAQPAIRPIPKIVPLSTGG